MYGDGDVMYGDVGHTHYYAGSPAHPSCGTTNLHLDISDATNVMVYCSVAVGAEEDEEMIRETVKNECCEQTYWRCTSSTPLTVGAMWHIYAAGDTDKIRSFLSKVLEERGVQQILGTDPIHDQLIYLDSDLRRRLHQEHGVQGWAIAQAVGDAIFIPAGAPHQVRNLCSCIKVAEDFVSPEVSPLRPHPLPVSLAPPPTARSGMCQADRRVSTSLRQTC
ncbi:Lysine-specific demethylase 3A [Geodia barretti]|uniref:Lysine-specific demethylase 3A n=1 Tax=Geodia barretti TaxID=519541 RepID=A0AA35XEB4_GEOBA|nr:Lysine-specific demethylase 3A [Geodia barretti]